MRKLTCRTACYEDIDLTLKAFSEVKQKIEQGFYSQIKLIDVSSDQFASY